MSKAFTPTTSFLMPCPALAILNERTECCWQPEWDILTNGLQPGVKWVGGEERKTKQTNKQKNIQKKTGKRLEISHSLNMMSSVPLFIAQSHAVGLHMDCITWHIHIILSTLVLAQWHQGVEINLGWCRGWHVYFHLLSYFTNHWLF